MNTLNYKVLLIETGFWIFARALGIYLLVTFPAMAADPVLYEQSALYAICFGWIAGLLFIAVFYLVQQAKPGLFTGNILLYAAAAVAVTAAFQAMEFTGVQRHIWQSGAFLIFPLIAVVSGWISMAISRRKINQVLTEPGQGAFVSGHGL